MSDQRSTSKESELVDDAGEVGASSWRLEKLKGRFCAAWPRGFEVPATGLAAWVQWWAGSALAAELATCCGTGELREEIFRALSGSCSGLEHKSHYWWSG